MKKRTTILLIALIISLLVNIYFITAMPSSNSGVKFDKKLTGLWIDGSTEIRIEKDGSFVWIDYFDDYISSCYKGYVDTNSLVMTQCYYCFYEDEDGYTCANTSYKTLLDIPSDAYSKINTFYRINMHGETVFGLSNVDGVTSYTFVKQQ